MRLEFPSDAAPLDAEWFDPLLAVIVRLPDEPPFSFLDPADVMVMGRVRRPGQPPITLYKHIHTRRYLNLDPQGRAYRYVPPRPWEDGDGRYRRFPTLLDGVEQLDLDELPWLKPGLEAHQAADAVDDWDDDEPEDDWWVRIDHGEACARYEEEARAADADGTDGRSHLRLA